VISRCRFDIPPPTLLIGSDVIKVVPKVNNLGFVLNERLTATDHFKKVSEGILDFAFFEATCIAYTV
jgi:hypothetical protein